MHNTVFFTQDTHKLYALCEACNVFAMHNKYGDRTELRSARNFEAHGTSKRTELRSTRNFEAHGTSKLTELRNARNFEAHGTSKRTELRSARNFENVFKALMDLITPEPIL